MSKLGPHPPLIAAFGLCMVFIFVHHYSAPAEPVKFTQPYQQGYTHPTQGASFLAVAHGKRAAKKRHEKSSHDVGSSHEAKKTKSLVQQEDKLLKDMSTLVGKESGAIKKEEHNLKKEEDLLGKEKTAFAKGDNKEVKRLRHKLDELTAAEAKAASKVDKQLRKDHKKEDQLRSLFQTWAASNSHPANAKWLRKHESHVNHQHRLEEKLHKLDNKQSRFEQGQAAFVQKREAFEHSDVRTL